MAATPVPTRGPQLLAVDIAFLCTAVIAYSLRCYVRIRMVKAFGKDDYLMGAATIGLIAYATSSVIGVHYGTGRHREHLPVEGYEKARHCWWFCYLFYCCSMISSKLSIGFFLLRIAVRKAHVWIIYLAMLISVVSCAAFFFVTLFQCNPISYFWNTSTQDGTCVNIEIVIALGYLYSVFSIISDFTFAILPAFIVMTLQLKLRTKIALIPLLAMGCIASAAVVARVPYMRTFRSHDFLWETTDIAIWSTVEQGLAVTAGSLAAIRPLLNLVLTRLGLSSQPTNPRLTPYGLRSSTHGFASRRRPSAGNDLDMYKLSGEAESGTVKVVNSSLGIPGLDDKELPKSPNWYTAPFQKMKRSSRLVTPTRKETDGDNDSEKSLRVMQNDFSATQSSSDERSMQIMVERSFFVTDAERKSYLEQGVKS